MCDSVSSGSPKVSGWEFSVLPVNLEELIKAVGYAGLFAIVFAESGLLIGFFLPGDSLLFTAGFLASEGYLHIGILVPLCVIAAITGDAVGYAFGRQVGRRLYDRPDSRFFKKKHLLAAEAFYEKHGGKTIVLARFLPVVRTFAPIVAGASNMQYRRFAIYNVFGGILWGAGVTIAGYLLGEAIPEVDRYLLPIIALIIFISIVPTLWHGRHLLLEQVRARLRRGRAVPAEHAPSLVGVEQGEDPTR
jgi:membrane-associated protein